MKIAPCFTSRSLSLCLAILSSLAGCGEPSSCASAGCGAMEFCVRHGSDVAGVPDSYACEPLPAACVSDKRCACLDDHPMASFNLEFCLAAGGCLPDGDTLRVTCPGG